MTFSGFWPAIWTMGNLGRAGYGASLEGTVCVFINELPLNLVNTNCQWPYSYDSCDVGTLPNQTYPGTQTPIWAVQDGDPYNNDMLVRIADSPLSPWIISVFLQSRINQVNGYVSSWDGFFSASHWNRRLLIIFLSLYPAACTCPGESHPGPMRSDGSYVGRSAPEIDIFEATVIHNVKGQVRKKKLMFVFY